ncbi:MAG: cobalt-precorrin-6A reductase [Vulcanimicrobiaceae bacterium]
MIDPQLVFGDAAGAPPASTVAPPSRAGAPPTSAAVAAPSRAVRTILILGGTQDARDLAGLLVDDRTLHVVSSLAGRTRAPSLPPGEVRVGGFGGVDGLVAYLRERHVAAVVDATHPFAARMHAHAARACANAGVPIVALDRPAWAARPGERFINVCDVEAAARVAAETGRRIFVTVGRQELAPFARIVDRFVLVRAIDPPDPALLPPDATVVLARGPFALADERALLRAHAIDCIVAKNSGGTATSAKLDAARELGISVVLVERPPRPPGTRVSSVADAARWVRAVCDARETAS